jgi:hypothetical protein
VAFGSSSERMVETALTASLAAVSLVDRKFAGSSSEGSGRSHHDSIAAQVSTL